MDSLLSILKVVHVITASLMAGPFYALVVVNQRGRLGPPLGDRADTYLENIIKNRTIPCGVFQATTLGSGLALLWARGLGPEILVNNLVLGLKFLLLFSVAGLLSYVNFKLQPRIDALFAQGGTPVSKEMAAQIMALRLRRKRLASTCLFLVLVSAMLGVQTWGAFPLWLTLALVVLLAAFTWRAYSSTIPWGWV